MTAYVDSCVYEKLSGEKGKSVHETHIPLSFAPSKPSDF
jgi:hypothetical protein